MKQIAIDLVSNVSDPVQKLNILREYLQACTLRSLHESGAFKQLSFVGGTALRFLYQLPRFSEDIDFSLENSNGYVPLIWLDKLKRDLSFQGFEAEVTWNDRKVVQVAWVKISGILSETNIVARHDQKLSIKIEIDTQPPRGAVFETQVVNKYMLFALRHHDLPSLMAGKVRALLSRSFQKGRDWYDLVWYLSQIPTIQPNKVLLENALIQPSEVNHYHSDLGWRTSISMLVQNMDMAKLRADVEAFLENPGEIEFLSRESIKRLLKIGNGLAG